jgi:hypothetical protein
MPRPETGTNFGRAVLGAAAVVVLTSACKKPVEKTPKELYREQVTALTEKHRADLGKRLEVVRAAQKASLAHPPLTPIAAPPSDAIRIIALDERDVADGPATLIPGCRPEYSFHPMFSALRGEIKDWTGAVAPSPGHISGFETMQQRAVDATHALVCRELASEEPVIDYGSHTFSGGTYRGECRLFELPAATYLGGFPLEASLKGRESRMTMGLASNLTERVAEAFGAAFPPARRPPGGSSYLNFTCGWLEKKP